jgi:cobalt-zinc-cadmium efflux system protein
MHNHHHEHRETENIRAAFTLNLIFAFIELIGGIFINSMAVVSNALHDMGDALSLGLSWYFSVVSRKDKTPAFSYGYRRFSLLAALINGLVLFVGSGLILYHSLPRIFQPEQASSTGMFVFAVMGVCVNGFAAYRLNGGGTMNERMMMLHLLEDVLGWTAVLIASIVMHFGNIPQLDPILAVLITMFIIWNAVKNLKTTMMIFMQGVPDKIDLADLEKKLTELEGVKGIHDLHVWTLDGEHNIASLHVVVEKPLAVEEMVLVKNKIREITSGFQIDHATIEVECGEQDCMVHPSLFVE